MLLHHSGTSSENIILRVISHYVDNDSNTKKHIEKNNGAEKGGKCRRASGTGKSELGYVLSG
jgi:hypothetical protein